jgi:hypothetical protein
MALEFAAAGADGDQPLDDAWLMRYVCVRTARHLVKAT